MSWTKEERPYGVLIHNPGGLTVIDDAFNSNIRGAEQAFRVLKETKKLFLPAVQDMLMPKNLFRTEKR